MNLDFFSTLQKLMRDRGFFYFTGFLGNKKSLTINFTTGHGGRGRSLELYRGDLGTEVIYDGEAGFHFNDTFKTDRQVIQFIRDTIAKPKPTVEKKPIARKGKA